MARIRRKFAVGDALLLLFSILLTHSHSSVYLEGFDPDDPNLDVAEDTVVPATPAPLTTTSLSSSYSPDDHHSPPSDPPLPSPSVIWDEDEFEGIPSAAHPQEPGAFSQNETHPTSSPSALEPSSSSSLRFLTFLRSYVLEVVLVVFLISFSLNYLHGRRLNEAIAFSWANNFASKDSILEKNFNLLGVGDGNYTPLLLREGHDVFKFYAGGRRYCQGILAKMELLSRHDLLSRALYLVFPKRDTITFEVVMNEDSMDHVVFALAWKKTANAMHKGERDLKKFASTIVAPPAGRHWVADELMVVAESKEVAGDMVTDVVLEQVFGHNVFEKFGKWFVSLHFSDQNPGSRKKNLIFKFVLPDAVNMSDMIRLVALVPYYIDLIGRYKLSPHARSKTEAARIKAAQEAHKELQNIRQEALQKKKAEKKKLMEEVESRLNSVAIRKKEEREQARQLKSGPKVKMLRR
ncbi:uncharacterized protein At5g49945-like [Zingiber officinale]|uniref:DUF1682 family protein n=1 Tax=Zingiber officinale TaxID=94328 RepID=A0A8J5ERQ3_ZINOF|nr:uncharacterized protein At5g49945-like [Zingiber officinale]KAG6474317.1 hypothetical protein ZIOFF_068243 [Zingiber officinale]